MIIGIVLFGILVFMISLVLSRRLDRMDRGELSTYVLLIAWGSLCAGFLLATHAACGVTETLALLAR